MSRLTRFSVPVLFGAALGALPAIARAALFTSCSASATGVSFGVYSPLSPSGLNSTGSITVTCTALVPGTAPVTIALSAGSSGTFAARSMRSGASSLSYNLYVDAAETQIWGDGTGGSVTDTLNVTIPLLGTGQATATVYGLMPPLQDVTPGAYTDTIIATVSY